VQCSQCTRQAIYTFGPSNAPLCLHCYALIVQINQQQVNQLDRMANQALQDMEDVVGAPRGTISRLPDPVIVAGPTQNHNISIQNASVGLLNTGIIGRVDADITAINKADPALANAIAEMCSNVVREGRLSDAEKASLLEMLSVISEEVKSPKKDRRRFAITPILDQITKVVGTIDTLHAAWQKYLPIIQAALP